MKKQGVVRRWDAARGFGFIRGPGTSADVFFHVRDFRGNGGGMPVEGMTVAYDEIHVGGKGPRAMAVHPARVAASRPPDRQKPGSVRPDTSTPARGNWISWLIPVWAGIVGYLVVTERIPALVVPSLVVINVVTALIYAHDKSAARNQQRRTPESTLHVFALSGGWPTAWIVQQLLRHKWQKQAFQDTYAATVLLHMAVLIGWAAWATFRRAY